MRLAEAAPRANHDRQYCKIRSGARSRRHMTTPTETGALSNRIVTSDASLPGIEDAHVLRHRALLLGPLGPLRFFPDLLPASLWRAPDVHDVEGLGALLLPLHVCDAGLIVPGA